jgi:hypothetical protein
VKLGAYVEVSDPNKDLQELLETLQEQLQAFFLDSKMRLLYGHPESCDSVVEVEVHAKFSWSE